MNGYSQVLYIEDWIGKVESIIESKHLVEAEETDPLTEEMEVLTYLCHTGF